MLFSPSPRYKRLQLRIADRRLLLVVGDISALLVAISLSIFVWTTVHRQTYDSAFRLPRLSFFLALVILWFLLANANNLYALTVSTSQARSLRHLGSVTFQLALIYLLIFFFSPRNSLPRLFIAYYATISFVSIACWRMLNLAFFGGTNFTRRILIIGVDDSAATLVDAIERYAQETYEVRGIIGAPEDIGNALGNVSVIGAGDDIPSLAIRENISELVITSIPKTEDDIYRGIMQAYEHGIVLIPMPIIFEQLTGRVPVKHIQNTWETVLPIAEQSAFNLYPILKRSMDIVLASIGMFVFIVLLPLLALAIRMEGPGRILCYKTRVGRNGRSFRVAKFRSSSFRFGRFLKRTHLDDLPRFVNVFKGSMSIVGPQPDSPQEIKQATVEIPFYRTRLVIRPGLIGWAQIHHIPNTASLDAEAKLGYDIYYIRNQSLILDMTIIFRAIGKSMKSLIVSIR